MDHSTNTTYSSTREDMYKVFTQRARDLLQKFGEHIPDQELQDLRLDVRALNRENFRFLQERTGAQALAGIEESKAEVVIKRTIQELDALFGSKYASRLAASVTLYRMLHHEYHVRLVDRRNGKPFFTIGAMYDLTSAVYEHNPQLCNCDREIRTALELLEQFILRTGDAPMKEHITARQRQAVLHLQIAKAISPLKVLITEQQTQVSVWQKNRMAEYKAHADEVRTRAHQKVTALVSLEEVGSALSLLQEVIQLDEFARSLMEEGARHESWEFTAIWDERECFAIAMDNAGREYEAHAQDIRDTSSSRSRRKTRLKDEEDARSYQERASVCYEIAHTLRKGDLAALLAREREALGHSAQGEKDPSLKERRDVLIIADELAGKSINDAIAFALKSGIVTSEAQAYALTLAPLLRQ